ncbi:MAG: hypothetical protein F6K54_22530 [Okeania sp. SIO3B5]|uniref:hypothetical protein n=1 Tax=Okeania sp. SIO3B5 TaxID=2607811 RepID=UPI0013FEA60E|nr:hypothetical protein [Okeania sp. SIO3B5]NEO55602.1 hypothetical protein [Okeania sp. SIO3B5]
MSNLEETLKSVRFLVDAKGNKTAVQLSITAWEAILNWIENREDETIVSEAMKELKNAGSNPQKAGWLDWDAVKDEWDKD